MTNKHHCKVDSRRSLNGKEAHYKLDIAYKEGRAAATEKYPAALTPEKYYRDKDMADSWQKGFMDGLAKKGST